MNLKTIAKCATAVVLAAGLATGLAGPADAKTRLKMGSTYPSKLVQLGSLGKTLESNVDAMSDGELQLKFYEPNALVPALELFDAVRNGSVDAG